MDQHIPSSLKTTDIDAAFEQFYQGLVKDISNISEEDLSALKTKISSTCEKYTRLNVPYKYQQTVKELSKNQIILIMKQDKGCGVVIMGKSKYHDNCLSILKNDNFKILDHDSTEKPEQTEQILRKNKNISSQQEYIHLYPSRSYRGKFYGTAKVHKIFKNDTVDELPIRLVASNIGTATYDLTKYLAKLLSPLSQLEYIIKNTKEFAE